MWYTIKNFHQPNSLSQAIELYKYPERIFISGGSYLVAQRNAQTHELINIHHLLGKKICVTEKEIILEAGVTLQEIADQFSHTILGEIAKKSSFSKNIRNQRTIGGEIAQKNLQSDLYVSFVALNAILKISDEKEESIKDWNGIGIITKIILDTRKISQLKFFRYTIMPSAAPFLIFAAVPEKAGWKCVVGGKVSKMQEIISNENTEQMIHSMSQELAQNIGEDQYGTVAYKAHLIKLSFQNLQK